MALGMEPVIIDVMSDDGVKPYNTGRKASPKSISAAKRDALAHGARRGQWHRRRHCPRCDD